MRELSRDGFLPVFNAGSSSLKFALFDTVPGLVATMRGEVENLDAERAKE